MRAKALTKSYLQEIGITALYQGKDGTWAATRSFRTGSGSLQSSQVRQRMNNGVPSLAFSVNGKTIQLSLARVIYVWYFRDIYEDEVIAFVDGNSKRLDVENIVCVSLDEAKRMSSRTAEQCAADWAEHARKFGPLMQG